MTERSDLQQARAELRAALNETEALRAERDALRIERADLLTAWAEPTQEIIALRGERDRLGATAALLREALVTIEGSFWTNHGQYPKRVDEMTETEAAIARVASELAGTVHFMGGVARAALAADPDEWLRARIEREVELYREAHALWVEMVNNFLPEDYGCRYCAWEPSYGGAHTCPLQKSRDLLARR